VNAAPARLPARAIEWRTALGLDARWLIGGALVLNLLLFARVAVASSPFYSYQGPSGADRVYYYAYARSLVIDHDLDFTNEFAARPPSSGAIFRNGRQLNKYPIGTPLLSLPAFAVVHGVMSALRLAGSGVSTDGYSAPYALAFALSQMAFALLGIWLLYLTLLRYFAERIAAVAVVAVWLGTNALHYTAVDLMMSHAAALFSTGWCGYESVTLSESPERPSKWFRLGASGALVALVRYQNAVFLLMPFAAALVVLANGRPRRTATAALLDLGSAALGGVTMLMPQLAAWKAVFGAWMVNSYEQEFAFTWRHPHLLDILFRSPSRGLVIWLPLLTVGLVGCLTVAVRRGNALALAAAVAWTINLCIISAWWAWASIAQRSAFDCLLPLGLGVGAALTALPRRWQSAVISLLAMLVVWNVPFAAIGVPEIVPGHTLCDGWLQCLRALL
jgi:hypothetical protein